MTDQIPLGDIHFFMFVIPGFITVWSYRYAIRSEKHADFEYFGLSAFWGLTIAALYSWIIPDKDKVAELLSNPYAAALALSVLGSAAAFGVASWKPRNRVSDFWNQVKAVFWLIAKKK